MSIFSKLMIGWGILHIIALTAVAVGIWYPVNLVAATLSFIIALAMLIFATLHE